MPITYTIGQPLEELIDALDLDYHFNIFTNTLKIKDNLLYFRYSNITSTNPSPYCSEYDLTTQTINLYYNYSSLCNLGSASSQESILLPKETKNIAFHLINGMVDNIDKPLLSTTPKEYFEHCFPGLRKK